MLGNLSGAHLVVILFIVLLLFGAPKLPGLAKSLGQSMRILKKEVTTDTASETSQTVADEAAVSQPVSAKAAAAAPAAPAAAPTGENAGPQRPDVP
ncbi:Sec-independent protein translocase subunit TatA/TatB [Leucobacter tenebrionis]|uniref:Sec-independent protein translocase subunit TatA/TatB n=1 Tax=Leucobacter tenebrionis TaxID=2873270 RepID=UPI001CA6EC03|nr:twin-arginine translocase TatA/TatE family subunit [Leucobacter tenebrionis]QZY53014.1 twin-arginine translocase TatA/TatE family subunit [Leucobacter tenebrionis]